MASEKEGKVSDKHMVLSPSGLLKKEVLSFWRHILFRQRQSHSSVREKEGNDEGHEITRGLGFLLFIYKSIILLG